MNTPPSVTEDDLADFKRGLRIGCLLCVPIWLIVALTLWITQ